HRDENSRFLSRQANRPPFALVTGLRQSARVKVDPPFRVWAAIYPAVVLPRRGLFCLTLARSAANDTQPSRASLCARDTENTSRMRNEGARAQFLRRCRDFRNAILTAWRGRSPCISVSIARSRRVLRSRSTI